MNIRKRTRLCITFLGVAIILFILLLFPLTRTGKKVIVLLFEDQLTDYAEELLSDPNFTKCEFLLYKVEREKTDIVTFSHSGAFFPLLSPYTEQIDYGIFYSKDRKPKGLGQSLAYSDFALVPINTGWKWEEDPSTGDNAMYVYEIIPGWYYYEWHW